MEKLNKKYAVLVGMHKELEVSVKRYTKSLETNLDIETKKERHDSTIKRFGLTYDLLWKYLKEYIATTHGLTFDSPRKAFQQCLTSNLTDTHETEQLLQLIESRNLNTHTYDAVLQMRLSLKLPHILTLFTILSFGLIHII